MRHLAKKLNVPSAFSKNDCCRDNFLERLKSSLYKPFCDVSVSIKAFKLSDLLLKMDFRDRLSSSDQYLKPETKNGPHQHSLSHLEESLTFRICNQIKKVVVPNLEFRIPPKKGCKINLRGHLKDETHFFYIKLL